MRRNKDDDLTPVEHMIKYCLGEILKDLCPSEKELNQLEQTLKNLKRNY